MGLFFKMVMRSVKRRRREMRFVSAAVFIAVLFLSGISVFQNVMNRYVTEKNYLNYGDPVRDRGAEKRGDCAFREAGASIPAGERDQQHRRGGTRPGRCGNREICRSDRRSICGDGQCLSL